MPFLRLTTNPLSNFTHEFLQGDQAQVFPTHSGRGSWAVWGLFEIHIFQKELFFQVEEVYISGTTELPMKAPIPASFFFSIWACACTALVDIPGGLVVSDSSLGITSGLSMRPGGCPWCYRARLCDFLCPSAPQGKGSSPEAPGSAGHAPSKGRALAEELSTTARGESTGTQPHTLSHCKSHKPFY